jgi:hypothetical protein
MATLNIGGQRVKVDDAFLSMTPEQQQQTVEEIAGQLGSAQPSAYDESLRNASAMTLQGGPGPRQAPQQPPLDLGTATAATISGFVNELPIAGPLAQGASDAFMGGVSQLTGGDYGETVRGLQEGRERLAERAPISDAAGSIAGGLAGFGGLGAVVGKEAIGLGGKMLPGIGKAAAANQGIYTADQHVRGNTGLDTLGMGLPALAGVGGRVAGDAIDAAGRGISNAVTRGAQRKMTTEAVQGAPTASELKSAASEMFEASTGGQPLMISDTAYFRFLGGVKQAANKLRINPNLDQKSVGLLEMLMQTADDVAKGGVAVDMKDLHILRQAAQKVAQSSEGRDAAFANMVIRQLDDSIQSLKPADILGGADPSQAANALMKGISTWHRASKVSVIEEAINKAGTYKSGLENGLRLQFQALLRNPKTRKMFTGPELRAIEDVANGTGKTNLVTLLGKFGFGTDGAGNMLGGTIGASVGGTLGSLFGPLGTAAGIGLAGGAGIAARKASERMGVGAARRAAQAVATPNLPIARQAPNLLSPAARPTDLLIRSSGV